MRTETSTTQDCVLALHDALAKCSSIPPLTKSFFIDAPFPLESAYEIQRKGIDLRIAAGNRIVGYKMGLTSKAKMEQMGLHTPIFGVLLNTMQVSTNVDLAGQIHPKIEPEIALILGKELRESATEAEAWQACEAVAPALEILDSRYRDFKYFSLPDVIADNSSSSQFILGKPLPTKQLKTKIDQIPVELFENETSMAMATSKEALGNPLSSLCELVKLLWQYNRRALPAGSIVLTGALTTALALKDGQSIRGAFGELGEILVKVKGNNK